MARKQKPAESTKTEIHPENEDVARKLAELSQYEEALKSKEAELLQWFLTLSQWREQIRSERERLSKEGKEMAMERHHLIQWRDEVEKTAAQVEQEKRRVKETLRRLGILFELPSQDDSREGQSPQE